MPTFNIVSNVNEIPLNDRWVPAAKFNSKNNVVNEKGNRVGSDYNGRRYQIIEKRERIFSGLERIGRVCLGIAIISSTLFIALISKNVKNLFTKSKKSVRFAVLKQDGTLSLTKDKINPPVVRATVPSTDIENHVIKKPQRTDEIPDQVSISSSTEEYRMSEQELQEGIIISQDTISKIQKCMKNILHRKEEDGIKLYESQYNHRIFALDTIPGLIFKMKAYKNCQVMGRDDSMKARYQAMVNAQTVTRTHQLRLLVIPSATLFSVEAENEEYEIIAERKFDINPLESAQEHYFQEHAESLNEAVRQLALFICKTGYSDVEWRNNPVLNDSLDEQGNRKIALIDIEEMECPEIGLFGGGFGRRGLVRCVTEAQGKIVEAVARQNGISTSSFANAHARRKREIETGRKLNCF